MPVVAASEERALAAAMRSALQASRATAVDRRRVWELQIVNDISEVDRPLARGRGRRDRRARSGWSARSTRSRGSIALRNAGTGCLRGAGRDRSGRPAADPVPGLASPAESVIATRCAVRHSGLCVTIAGDRSGEPTWSAAAAISVPMLVKDELIGTLSIAAGDALPLRTRRRAPARDHRRPDRRSRCRMPGSTTSCGAASGSGSTPSTRSAIRSRCSTAAAACCAATPRWRCCSGGRSPALAADRPATASGSAAAPFRTARWARRRARRGRPLRADPRRPVTSSA